MKKTVDREPTKAMLDAARDWSYTKYGKPIGDDAATEVWRTMFDASQEPLKEGKVYEHC